MNIGIDIRPLMSPMRTGVGEYAYELLNALFDIDKHNQYFLFYNSWRDVSAFIPKWQQDNVHYIQTRWPNKIFHASILLLGWPKIDRLIVKKQENIKTKKQFNNLDYFFSPNIGFHALGTNCKHVLTLHDLSFELMPETFSFKRRLWHWILNPRKQCEKAHLILAPSHHTKRDISRVYHISEEKIKVIAPGLSSLFENNNSRTKEVTYVRSKYNLPEKFLLFLGTIEPRKNLEVILEAYKVLQEDPEFKNSNFKLVIAGPLGWKYKKIIRQIEGIAGVRYIGYVEAEDKPALYKAASLFIYPSLYEGFGFPVLEAMASGIPVIASQRSSLVEVGGKAPYYVNPYNVEELILAIKQILGNSSLREYLGKEGKAQAKKFYWHNTARQLLQLFESSPSLH